MVADDHSFPVSHINKLTEYGNTNISDTQPREEGVNKDKSQQTPTAPP